MLFLLSLALTSCESSYQIPTKLIANHERLTDTELQQLKQQELQHHNIFYFGFDLRASPQEDAAQYLPFLHYLEATTGYYFKLHFTPKNSDTIEELGQNIIQFAAMGADGFLKAQAKYSAKSLVRGINEHGKAEYQSVFVVKTTNQDIHNISDIKGRKLAFGNVNSTQGHLIPRIMLTENGISLKDLKTFTYTGSHQNCAEAVVSGKFDVCGMQDKLAKSLASQGLVKIIHTSRYFPSSGIVASKSVPADVTVKVKQALLDFDPRGRHSKGLYHWDSTEMPEGFTASKESDYADLRQWSIKLGFLQGNPLQEQVK